MRRSAILLAILFAASAVHAEPPEGYRLGWEDDFGGDKLDRSKWTPETHLRRGNPLSAGAVTVKDGVLTITTYTEGSKHYTGFITTKGKFETAYGYFEARIRFNSSPGQWGAFWLHSPTIGDPVGDPARAGTEIDIVEHRARDNKGQDVSNLLAMNLHWDGYKPKVHQHAGHSTTAPVGTPSPQGHWHSYGLLWTAEGYTFYLDGAEQWKTDKAVSKRSEFLLLTCEIEDKGWAGDIPAGGYGPRGESKTTMEVDWVRVWQRAPAREAGPPAVFEDALKGKLAGGWEWLRENPKAWRHSEKGLEIRVEPGLAGTVKNALLRKAPDRSRGKYAIEVTVEFTSLPSQQYEQAGLTWYQGDKPALKLVHEFIDGKTYVIPGKKPTDTRLMQLRLVVSKDQYVAQYRPDAKGEFQTADSGKLAPGTDEKVSIQCYNGPPKGEHWMRFSDFKIVKLPE